MTNNTENEAVEPELTDPIPVSSEPETPEPEEAEPRSNEAKKYRLRLRETETERDQLREQITNMQRAEIERLAAPILAKPDSLWVGEHVQIADLLNEAGTVDHAAVTATAERVRDALGLAAPYRPIPKSSPSGKSLADRGRYENDGFAEAFKPSSRRNI